MRLVFAFLLALLNVAGRAGAQMPDLGSMSGTPLPTADLPNGTVSVRVVRGDLSNNVAGQVVELHGTPQDQKVTTDESGRAVFNNVPVGASVHVMTVLDGQQIESRSFPMPATGGVRLILVGGAGPPGRTPAQGQGAAPAPAAPATPGTVVLGGQSRFVVEVTDEGLDVYNLLDIVNGSGGPVATEPLIFETPDGAQQLTVLEGSSPRAKADGRRFVVTGPFAPGITTVQMAYRLEYSTGAVDFEQVLPAALSATQIIVRKVGGLTFRSPQAASAREMRNEGNTYIMASGQGLAPGARVQFQLDGLPHHSRLPRFVALGIAVFFIGLGVWLAVNGPDPRLLEARQKLEQKRAALLDDLVALERQRAAGTLEPLKFESRRETLVAQLERVYAQLDHRVGAAAQAARAAAPASAPAPRAHAAR
jgi:hypothetical protein